MADTNPSTNPVPQSRAERERATLDEAIERTGSWLDAYGIQHPRKRAFLVAYSLTGVVTRSSQMAGIHIKTHYDWMHDDPEYPQAFEEAKRQSIEIMEAEARRRGVEGWEEPIIDRRGRVVGKKRRYSDLLLIFMLKGALPEKYRDNLTVEEKRTLQLNVNVKGSVTHDLSRLTVDELEQLDRIQQRLSGPPASLPVEASVSPPLESTPPALPAPQLPPAAQ